MAINDMFSQWGNMDFFKRIWKDEKMRNSVCGNIVQIVSNIIVVTLVLFVLSKSLVWGLGLITLIVLNGINRITNKLQSLGRKVEKNEFYRVFN